ncbi:MAG: hypothetical protein M3332_16330, partial [Actinomycetota bacterium]|nr:hypothetical protein [Actinomycetota bacterium]
LKTGQDIFLAALKLLENPQRLYRACTSAQRKMLNNVIFTKLNVDATGIVDDELAEPFNALVPAGRHYTHNGALPADQTPPGGPTSPDAAPHGRHRTGHLTAALPGHSSSKTTWVPPAGFEPALPPPEAGTRRALWCL